jgi:hypothetical protein
MHGVLALLDSVTLWGRITRHPAGDRPPWTALATKCRSSFSNIVPGAFTPVPAKHSKSISLIDCVNFSQRVEFIVGLRVRVLHRDLYAKLNMHASA